MTQVEFYQSSDDEQFQIGINDALKKLKDVEIIDIKYQVYDEKHGMLEQGTWYSALIIYRTR